MQDNSAEQIFEDLQDILQQTILRAYPNPERKGCPGPDVLRELANRPSPTRDAAWEHVTHCSPCYREFLDLRAQVRQQQDFRRRRARQKRALVGGVAALIVIPLGYEILHHGSAGPNQQPGQYQSASLDLKDRSVARGAQGLTPKARSLILPARRLDLTVFLPIGSDPGRYEVQLLRRVDEPLLSLSGEATLEHGTTVLRAKLDLTGQPAGSFLVGLRQPPSEWTYYPVIVR